MGKLQCSGSSGGSSSSSVQGLATVPVTARVALLDRPLPEAQEQTGSGNRNRNRSWKPKTGLDWAGLGWMGQDRTGRDKPQHAPGLTGQVRTGRGTNELGFWHVCGFERGGSWRDGGRKCRNRGPSENSEKESSVRMGEGDDDSE